MFSSHFSHERPVLLCAASKAETDLVLRALGKKEQSSFGPWRAHHFHSCSVLETGVGKSNAAAGVATELTRAQSAGRQYAAVLCLGIAGSYTKDLALGSAVLADSCVFADEGTILSAEKTWRSLEEAGFAQITFAVKKTAWWHELEKLVDRCGCIATISTISGNESLSRDYQSRSNALAEAMEGAAIAQSCARFDIDFAELRSISNYCGNSDREKNPWDIGAAFSRLAKTVSDLGLELQTLTP